MKAIMLISIVLVFTFNGCTTKEFKYIKPPKYSIEKLPIDGIYIEPEKQLINNVIIDDKVYDNNKIVNKHNKKLIYAIVNTKDSTITITEKGIQRFCTPVALQAREPFKLMISDYYHQAIDDLNKKQETIDEK